MKSGKRDKKKCCSGAVSNFAYSELERNDKFQPEYTAELHEK
jgi:hypothetical protein